MSSSFTLVDRLSLADLHVYLGRALRIEDGSVRLISGSGVLAVYVAVLHPSGLMDESPTVLGLRTFAMTAGDAFDSVVPLRALLMRIESRLEESVDNAPIAVRLPIEVHTVTWTAISPPRGGWHRLDHADPAVLDAAARSGIEEVAAAIPVGTGEQIVHRVRTDIWSKSIDGLGDIPSGAAFAALSLGFLGEPDPVAVFESGAWTRLTTRSGHVLIKRRAWSLSR